jgi:hypothetical protein
MSVYQVISDLVYLHFKDEGIEPTKQEVRDAVYKIYGPAGEYMAPSDILKTYFNKEAICNARRVQQ